MKKILPNTRDLPPFIGLGAALFEAYWDDFDDLIHTPLDVAGRATCTCEVSARAIAPGVITAQILFRNSARWAECILELKPRLPIPGHFDDLSDCVELFKLAASLKDLPSWDSVGFTELMGFVRTLTALDIFTLYPPLVVNPLGPRREATALFELHTSSLGALDAEDLCERILERLFKEFFLETVNYFNATNGTHADATSADEATASVNDSDVLDVLVERQFFMFDNRATVPRKIEKIFTSSNFVDSLDHLVELIVFPYFLDMGRVGGSQSKIFSVHSHLRPLVERAGFAPLPVFKTPEPITDPELTLLVNFAEMYLEKASTDVTRAGGIFNGLYAREIFEPAWLSFKAATK